MRFCVQTNLSVGFFGQGASGSVLRSVARLAFKRLFGGKIVSVKARNRRD